MHTDSSCLKFAIIDPKSNVVESVVSISHDEQIVLSGLLHFKKIIQIPENKSNVKTGSLFINGTFVERSPHPSWKLNSKNLEWESPKKMPQNKEKFFWNEVTKSWVSLSSILSNSNLGIRS